MIVKGFKFLSNEKGTTAIEFMLLLPFVLFLTMGIIILSIAIYGKIAVADACREAARATALGYSDSATKAEEIINGMGFPVASVHVNTNNNTGESQHLYVDQKETGSSVKYIKVRVVYNMPSIVPSLPRLIGSDADWNVFTLTSISTVKKESR